MRRASSRARADCSAAGPFVMASWPPPCGVGGASMPALPSTEKAVAMAIGAPWPGEPISTPPMLPYAMLASRREAVGGGRGSQSFHLTGLLCVRGHLVHGLVPACGCVRESESQATDLRLIS